MNPSKAARGLCFVISPIGGDASATRKRSDQVLNYVIRPAVECLGLTVERGDEITKPGAVIAHIIANLINAEAVVADLTELNPNVFYELAIRDSFRRPVVLIAEIGTALPFDLIQQRTIFFDHTDLHSVDLAKQRLTNTLVAALENPAAGSPVTRAAELEDLGQRQNLVVTLGESMTNALEAEVQRLISEAPQKTPTSAATGSRGSREIDLDSIALRLLSAAQYHGVFVPKPLSLANIVESLGARGIRDVSTEDLKNLRRAWKTIPVGTRSDELFRANALVRREMRSRGT